MTTEITPYQAPVALDLVAVRMEPEKFPRLTRYSQPSAVNLIAQVVAMAYTYTGRAYEYTDLRAVATGLHAELMRDPDGVGTKSITIDEIAHAVRAAVLGDSMYGVNVASLYKAVRAYCVGEGHDAQEAANRRVAAKRQQLLQRSGAGAMLQSYTGEALKQMTGKK